MPRRTLVYFLALFALAAGVYLIGNASVSLWDRDEPRYAQTSRQMLQSGDWIVPRLMDEVRAAKPIFIYWCQATAMRLFGDNAFAARLPSVIAMLATLVLLLLAVRSLAGPRRALWTVFIFATSALAIAAAKMSITDAVLLLFVTAAQLCLYAMLRGHASWPIVITFGIAIGMAGLTKGPVVLGVLGTTLLALATLNWLDRKQSWRGHAMRRRRVSSPGTPGEGSGDGRRAVRRARLLKTLAIIAVVFCILAPWLIAMERRQPGYLLDTLWKEVIVRAGKPLEGHKGPPGYYLLMVWATYFPWSLLLPTAITMAWRHRRVPAIRFALAAVIGPWVMFEIVQTKLPHYVLPTYPFLAFLTADALVRCMRRQHDDLVKKRFVWMTAGWSIVVVLIGLAPWAMFAVLGALQERLVNVMTIVSALSLAWAIVVFRHVRARRIGAMAISMGVGMFIMVGVFYAAYFPRAEFLRLSSNLASVLIENGVTTPGSVVSIGYKEPSLVFHQGGSLRPVEREFLIVRPRDEWPEWIVIDNFTWLALPPDVVSEFEEVARFRGINYADDPRPIEVLIVRRISPSPLERGPG